ncbi:EF-Tu/IF-2/RF-3 family GTPase [Methanococcoides methylutens]|uniref:Translation elongation factor 1 alpha-related protein n=1 Tax=Methanococcoides methylutens MM1 TaxID=1434104 RepID=A0A0E3SQ25_METMT|nr:EF-Tu/IF-2/RF-3 family GTPase [Methanococcoides methylutens]AKB84068.1 Translation elongation factor 1 alpha-related protein [Methanococcoides methylutens MM1]
MTKITIIGSEKSGRTTLASKLGKKGNTADITMYDFSKNDRVLTTIDAVGYPTSVKPMVTAFNLSDIVLLCVPPEGLDAHTGECIISLDLMGYKHGIIVLTKSDTSYPFALDELKEKIKKITTGTALENWDYISVSTTSFEGMEELKEMIFDMGDEVEKEQEELKDLPTRVVIDQSFNVTGIGCVVLGIVMQGTLNAKDKLVAFPTDKTVEVRSIQMHDVDAKSAPPGARVGLALKNVQSKDIERGFILSEKEDVTEDLTLKCQFSQFSKGFAIGDVPHIFVGLQSSPMRLAKIVVNGEEVERTTTDAECTITLTGSKLLAYNESDRFIICNLDDKQRFVGYGYKA